MICSAEASVMKLIGRTHGVRNIILGFGEFTGGMGEWQT
jgi:hypothetical protein